AAGELATVAEMVLVAHVALEHVGHRLEAAVRMRREAGDVVRRIVGRELVEHEKGVEIEPAYAAEAPTKLDASAVGGGDALDRTPKLYIGKPSTRPSARLSSSINASETSAAVCCAGLRSPGFALNPAKASAVKCGTGFVARSRSITSVPGCATSQRATKASV